MTKTVSSDHGLAGQTVQWVRVPIIEPLDIRSVWEHTPLAYYRFGEYPRFIRPVGAHQPRWEWKRVAIAGNGASDRASP